MVGSPWKVLREETWIKLAENVYNVLLAAEGIKKAVEDSLAGSRDARAAQWFL